MDSRTSSIWKTSMKDKSAKKMLNKSGPSIDPWDSSNVIASHSVYELFG